MSPHTLARAPCATCAAGTGTRLRCACPARPTRRAGALLSRQLHAYPRPISIDLITPLLRLVLHAVYVCRPLHPQHRITKLRQTPLTPPRACFSPVLDLSHTIQHSDVASTSAHALQFGERARHTAAWNGAAPQHPTDARHNRLNTTAQAFSSVSCSMCLPSAPSGGRVRAELAQVLRGRARVVDELAEE